MRSGRNGVGDVRASPKWPLGAGKRSSFSASSVSPNSSADDHVLEACTLTEFQAQHQREQLSRLSAEMRK